MVFNSLGSNYDLKFAIQSLLAVNFISYKKRLLEFLDKKYKGKTILLYKGREAIKLALSLSSIPIGSKVGINGFTCYVVYQAVIEAGYKPVLIDLAKGSLNFNTQNLEKHNDLKAIIVQNTLGAPVDIRSVKSFCRTRKAILIEDLAHSVGSIYKDGIETGLNGDFIALSFSQDKMVDAVSGGALVIRNKNLISDLDNIEFKPLSIKNQLRDRWYPVLTFNIRKLYPVGLGKILHYLFKKARVLSDPVGVDETIDYHTLPAWYCSLIVKRFLRIQHEIIHRRAISRIYIKNITKNVILSETVNQQLRSSNIRFPVIVTERAKLIHYLKKQGIYVSDIWYDAPIAPKKLIDKTDYNNQCPISEEISDKILNLPTHINISVKQAEKISVLINQWINTNQK